MVQMPPILFSDPVPPRLRTLVGFGHDTILSNWENPSTLFQMQETTLRDLFPFGRYRSKTNLLTLEDQKDSFNVSFLGPWNYFRWVNFYCILA